MEKNKRCEVAVVSVEKAVMQKINEEKIKIKCPAVLVAQKTGWHCARFVFLAMIIVAGIFFAKWVVGKF